MKGDDIYDHRNIIAMVERNNLQQLIDDIDSWGRDNIRDSLIRVYTMALRYAIDNDIKDFEEDIDIWFDNTEKVIHGLNIIPVVYDD